VCFASTPGADRSCGSETIAARAPEPRSLHGDTVYPHILLDRAKPGLIAVNKDGRRFVMSPTSYHDFVEGMFRSNAATPSVPAWLICDRSFIRDYGIGLVHPGAGARTINRFIADGYLKRAGTLMELAQRIGVDGKNLLRTVQEHNRFAETGVDEAFGKGGTEYNQFNGDPANKPNPCLRPIAEPPYFRGRRLSLHDGHLRRTFDRRECARAR